MPRAAGGRGRQPPVLKKFGQHFLTDPTILSAIVDALAPTKTDTVLEVGPGRGSLTDILAQRAGKVVAVEIDRALAAQLAERYPAGSHVEIVEGDFLESDARTLAGDDYLLIGNVPYYITTPIVFKAIESPMPRRSVFLVQREVAERMAATAADEDYGALSVNIAVVANVEQVLRVPARAFKPPPKVESAVVRLTPRAPARPSRFTCRLSHLRPGGVRPAPKADGARPSFGPRTVGGRISFGVGGSGDRAECEAGGC